MLICAVTLLIKALLVSHIYDRDLNPRSFISQNVIQKLFIRKLSFIYSEKPFWCYNLIYRCVQEFCSSQTFIQTFT